MKYAHKLIKGKIKTLSCPRRTADAAISSAVMGDTQDPNAAGIGSDNIIKKWTA